MRVCVCKGLFSTDVKNRKELIQACENVVTLFLFRAKCNNEQVQTPHKPPMETLDSYQALRLRLVKSFEAELFGSSEVKSESKSLGEDRYQTEFSVPAKIPTLSVQKLCKAIAGMQLHIEQVLIDFRDRTVQVLWTSRSQPEWLRVPVLERTAVYSLRRTHPTQDPITSTILQRYESTSAEQREAAQSTMEASKRVSELIQAGVDFVSEENFPTLDRDFFVEIVEQLRTMYGEKTPALIPITYQKTISTTAAANSNLYAVYLQRVGGFQSHSLTELVNLIRRGQSQVMDATLDMNESCLQLTLNPYNISNPFRWSIATTKMVSNGSGSSSNSTVAKKDVSLSNNANDNAVGESGYGIIRRVKRLLRWTPYSK